PLQRRYRAGAGPALAPLEWQPGELGADLGQRQRGLEPEFGLGVDRAAQRDDARGEAPRLLEKVGRKHPAFLTGNARGCQRRHSAEPCNPVAEFPVLAWPVKPMAMRCAYREARFQSSATANVAGRRHSLDFVRKP